MSLITPILTVTCCACAVPHSNAAVSAARLKRRFISHSPLDVPSGTREASNSQIVVQFLQIGLQLRIGEAFDDTTVLHHIVAVGDRRSEPKVLLNQEDGEALLLEHADGVADLLD